MKAIKCKDLTKTYRKKKALNQLTFSIEENKLSDWLAEMERRRRP